jgi:drug/metabolite transporter (DMT)-like permease
MQRSRETRAFLLLTLVTFVWAGLMPTGKIALQSVPPLTIGAIRLTLGSCLLRLYMGRNPAHQVQWSPSVIASFALLYGFSLTIGRERNRLGSYEKATSHPCRKP